MKLPWHISRAHGILLGLFAVAAAGGILFAVFAGGVFSTSAPFTSIEVDIAEGSPHGDGFIVPASGGSWTPPPPPPPPPPSCTLSLDPASIIETQSAELSWTTSRASTLTINQGIGSVTPVSGGSVTVSPTVTTTYTGTVSGSTGTASCTAGAGMTAGSGGSGVVLSVSPLPQPTVDASPRFSQTGRQCTLDWTVSNTTDTLTCTLTGQGTTLGSCTGAGCARGSASSNPLQGKTAFTLTCTDTVENLGLLTDEAECLVAPQFEEF